MSYHVCYFHIVGTGVQNICMKEYKKSYFFPSFFNIDSSFDIKDGLLKLSVVVPDMIMEGTVCRIFLFRP